MKILFVDDEKIIREGMAEIIRWEALGCKQLTMAESGDKALRIMENEVFDLVITDIYMQKMTGIQLAKQIKERWPHVKVIILSAYEDFGYAREAIEAGVFKYLLKPIAPEELEAAVSEAMIQVHSDIRLQNQVLESEKLVSIYRPQLAKDFWKALLRQEIAGREDLEQRMYLAGIVLKKEAACCLAVSVKPGGEAPDKKLLREAADAAKAALSGVFDWVRLGEGRLILILSEPPSRQELLCFQSQMEGMLGTGVRAACGRTVSDLQALHQSLEDALTVLKSSAEEGQDAKNLVSQSVFMIQENLSQGEFGVNDIAEALHVSAGYFSRMFRKQMGITCIDYITRQRIEKAKELLIHTDLKHESVAQAVGYSNVYYFSVQFKKQTGETPGQYRKRMESRR